MNIPKSRVASHWPTACWLAATVIFLVYTLGLTLLIGEHILKNSPQVQQVVVREFSKSLPFPVRAGRLELNLFPAPKLLMGDVRVQMPDLGEVTADSIKISPSPRQLLRGELRLSDIVLSQPHFDLSIPSVPGDEEEDEVFQARDLVRILSGILSRGAKMHVRSGSARIALKGREFGLTNISADLAHPDGFSLDLRANSSLFSDLTLNAHLPPKHNLLQGRLHIQDMQAKQTIDLLGASGIPLWPETDRLDVTIAFSTPDTRRVDSHIAVSSDSFLLCTRESKHNLQGLELKTELNINGSALNAAIQRLSLGRPQFFLSGKLTADLKDPWLTLHLQGKDMIMPPLGKVCLDLFPNSDFFNKLFKVVRGGLIPQMDVSTQGSTADELKQQLVLQATIQNGTVHIPKLDLRLEEADGYAWVKDKVIYGSGFSARMDRVRGWKGNFCYGLEDREDRPIAVSTQISGPVHYVPPILHKTVEDKAFLRELDGLTPVQGHYQGQLRLNKTGEGVDFDIRATQFNIQGGHERLPWPVAVQGNYLHITNHRLVLDSAKADLGDSTTQLTNAHLSWADNPELRIQNIDGRLELDSFWPWIQSLPIPAQGTIHQLQLTGQAEVQDASLHLPFASLSEGKIAFTARVDEILANHPAFPHSVLLSSGQIDWNQEQSQVHNLVISLNDGQAQISGTLPGSPLDWKTPGLEMSFSADLGSESSELVHKLVNIPSFLSVQAPIAVEQGQFKHLQSGEFDFQARLHFEPDLEVKTHIQWGPEKIDIPQFLIQDQGLQTTVSVQAQDSKIHFAYSGQMRTSAVRRIFRRPWLVGDQGFISGNLQADMHTSPWRLTSINGDLSLDEIDFDLDQKSSPLSISRLRIQGTPQEGLRIEHSNLNWDDNDLALEGLLQPQKDGSTLLELKILANSLDWSRIQAQLAPLTELWTRASGSSSQAAAIEGQISIRIADFRYQDRIFSPLHLTWSLAADEPENVHILEQTQLCGISLPGKITIQPDHTQFTIAPSCKDLQLSATLACLIPDQDMATGTLDLQGHVQGTAPRGRDLTSNLNGSLNFTITDGRLLRFSLLAKLIEVLNSTEILFGSLPDLENEGIRFSSLQGTAVFEGSRIIIEKGIVHGHSLEMGFAGHLDLQEESVELTVLVAPFKTLDRLIKIIPLISGLTRGNLVTIPVRITGSWNDPQVIPLSPQAVSKELVDLMRRTLELPFKIFQPLMGNGNEKE